MNKLENYCEKYGFIYDNTKTDFKNIINHNVFKTLCIETYTLNPYMLLLRTIEKNVLAEIKDGRIMIRKRDKHKTSIADIVFDQIANCIVKKYNDIQYEIVFVIHNIYYKLLVVI